MLKFNKKKYHRNPANWWAIPVGLGLGLGWVAMAGLSIFNAAEPDNKEQ